MSKIKYEPYALFIIGRFFPSSHKDNDETGIPRYESDYWLHRFYPLSMCFLFVGFSEGKGGTLSRCAIGFRLAVRSVLSAENHIRDQYKPVTAIGTM